MLFDITAKVCDKGDKLTISYDGRLFEVECVESTVVEFERKYLMRFSDGSHRYMTAHELMNQSN
jgi:hypothetical protein